MKIAIKSKRPFRYNDPSQANELIFCAVLFDDKDQVDFVFNTVDFDKHADFNPDDDTFFDLLPDLGDNSKHDFFYVLEYSDKGIVLTQDFHDSLPLQSKIDSDELARALECIAEQKDFSCLEKMLLPLDTKPIPLDQITSDNDLPTLENYLQKHSSEIKRVYYPGAGMDFSPLQLFGRHIKGVDLFFTDYMSIPELFEVINRLEKNVNASILFPQDFNQKSWDDFWPTNIAKDEMLRHEPAQSWGKKFEFQSKDLDCTLTYLGTEGVQTAKILCEIQLAPDVLVLQDHGGSTNYALFSGENSYLHQAMHRCLPKYILMDPSGAEDTQIWPGYEQVTQVHYPKVYDSLPQNRNPRALFKRIKD